MINPSWVVSRTLPNPFLSFDFTPPGKGTEQWGMNPACVPRSLSRGILFRIFRRSKHTYPQRYLVLADSNPRRPSHTSPDSKRRRASKKEMSVSHEQRTAAEPRHQEIHTVVLSEITNINEDVRLLRLRPTMQSKIGDPCCLLQDWMPIS